MSSDFMNIAIPAVVGVISSLTAYFVARNNNSKDMTINDRQQLSEDEKNFRTELMNTINSYKTDLFEARKEIKELRTEVASLHKLNIALTVENRELQMKVDDLRDELKTFKGNRRGANR